MTSDLMTCFVSELNPQHGESLYQLYNGLNVIHPENFNFLIKLNCLPRP